MSEVSFGSCLICEQKIFAAFPLRTCIFGSCFQVSPQSKDRWAQHKGIQPGIAAKTTYRKPLNHSKKLSLEFADGWLYSSSLLLPETTQTRSAPFLHPLIHFHHAETETFPKWKVPSVQPLYRTFALWIFQLKGEGQISKPTGESPQQTYDWLEQEPTWRQESSPASAQISSCLFPVSLQENRTAEWCCTAPACAACRLLLLLHADSSWHRRDLAVQHSATSLPEKKRSIVTNRSNLR